MQFLSSIFILVQEHNHKQVKWTIPIEFFIQFLNPKYLSSSLPYPHLFLFSTVEQIDGSPSVVVILWKPVGPWVQIRAWGLYWSGKIWQKGSRSRRGDARNGFPFADDNTADDDEKLFQLLSFSIFSSTNYWKGRVRTLPSTQMNFSSRIEFATSVVLLLTWNKFLSLL